MRKKLLVFLLAVIAAVCFAFALTACNNDGNDGNQSSEQEGEQEEQGGQDTPAPNEHTYSEAWSCDVTHHWHAATCEHTEEVSEYAEHTIENGVCTVCNFISEGSEGIIYTLSQDKTYYTVSLVGVAPNETDIVIPSVYNGLLVKSIGSLAFWNHKSLISVSIGNGVTNIKSSAFDECSGLININLPDSMTTIGSSAFRDCSGLTSITIPDSVTSIGSSAFEDCSALTSIAIGNGVTSIEWNTFDGCSALTSITIGNGVTSIGNTVFTDCSSLKNISVDPDNKVYHSAGNCIIETETGTLIAGCNNSMIPNDGSVTNIGSNAFENCSGLTSVTMPTIAIRYIPKTNLQTVVLTSGSSIGGSAFYNCDGLTSITIPNSVTSIGEDAFFGCSGIINVENGISYVDKWIIDCDTEITSATLRADTVGIANFAFEDCSGLTSITIPDSVTSIGRRAFESCLRLTSIIIGNGVTSIGNSVFDYCSGLEIVYYKGTAEEWEDISIDTYNNYLKNATRYYYSETQPTGEGNFWHYDTDGVTPVAW